MQGLLADINIKGHMRVLLLLLHSKAWFDLWQDLNVPVRTFAELGLAPNASDAVIWHTCQQHQVVLITANRNQQGADSLEATIQNCNTPTSLPVLTFASPEEILKSKAHADGVVERLLEYLMEIDRLRGTGRLYLP
jgi:hypothetical protein